jgi:hypothetical protein
MEKGIEPKDPGSTLHGIVFIQSLIGDTYTGTVSFNWNAGGWWVDRKSRTGFTIKWNNPAPAPPETPQLEWSA